jgi:hypothetical protein
MYRYHEFQDQGDLGKGGEGLESEKGGKGNKAHAWHTRSSFAQKWTAILRYGRYPPAYLRRVRRRDKQRPAEKSLGRYEALISCSIDWSRSVE